MIIMKDENKNYIKNMLKSVKRDGIDSLIDYLESNGFFESPCSAKYHLNEEGGLAQHSINVYLAFKELLGVSKLHDEFNRINVPKESQVLVSFLHDICKIGRYIDSDKEKEKYTYNPNSIALGHGEKSLYLASKFIDLTTSEAMMIRWHMGTYDSGDYLRYQRGIEKFPEVLLFHMADNFASHFIDTKYEVEKYGN